MHSRAMKHQLYFMSIPRVEFAVQYMYKLIKMNSLLNLRLKTTQQVLKGNVFPS